MLQLIVNPVAGNGRAKAIGEHVSQYLSEKGVEHALWLTEHTGHATELSQKAAQVGASIVVAVGGDGTVSEAAAGLAFTQTSLGLVPAGTGNDFMKALGIPKDWRSAVDLILSRPAHTIDIGKVNEGFFTNVCGAGFDVMVLEYALLAKEHVRGILPYLYGVIRAIKNFKPFAMHIDIGDEIVLDGTYLLFSVANGKYFGGGIPIAPMADMADGQFDVVVVDAIPRWKIPFYLPGLLGGKINKYKITHHYRVSSCVLAATGMRIDWDGEIVPVERTAFTCQAHALRVHS